MADTKEIEPADATEASVPDDHQRVAADRIGTTLEDGKWTLEALIGMGGMAAVYRAKHKLGHHSAIKMMHREYASSADLVARFEREARALARLHHPGVVTIQDAGASDNGTPYVVMELLAGESVAARAAREGPLPESEVLAIAESLLEVLVAAHRQGIVHRDIKPGNLFLEDDGTLRVLDFGVAHVARGDGRKLTAVGTTLGTIQYMPPEQLRGERVDGRADLFALGATMYRLLSGHMLHSADDDQELMRKMLQEAPIPLQQRQPNVSDATALVVERALALDREQRYPGPATMLSDIEAVIAGEQPAFAAACARGERPSDIVETPATSRDFSEEEAAASTADAAAAATTPAVPAVVRAAADEARTVKMGVVSNDEEATTVPRHPALADAPTVKRPAAASTQLNTAPSIARQSQRPSRTPSSAVWKLAAAAAVAMLVMVVVWRSQRKPPNELTSDEVPPIGGAGTASAAPLTPHPQVGSPSAEHPDQPPSASDPPASDPPASDPPVGRPPRAGSAKPRPGLHLPPGLPTAFPSGLPTALPSALASALPTGLPTALPTAFPSWPPATATTSKPKPAPPPAPKPAPPPKPAPAAPSPPAPTP